MIRKIQDDLIQISSIWVSHYILLGEDSFYLLDGGFLGSVEAIKNAIKKEGLDWSNLEGIVMTHGHIDHTLNLPKILEKKNVPVYGHPLEKEHFAGEKKYRGVSIICGALEALSRKLFHFIPVQPDKKIEDGDHLDIWGGIKVIHTPGHTIGHCSFYSKKYDLLFAGDTFANWWYRTILPFPWFNSSPNQLGNSISRILELSPSKILANHCDKAGPEIQAIRFKRHFGKSRKYNKTVRATSDRSAASSTSL